MVRDHTSCGEVVATVWPDTNSTKNITSVRSRKRMPLSQWLAMLAKMELMDTA